MYKTVTMAQLSPLLMEKLRNGGEVIITVKGRSMLPMLRDGRDKVCLTGLSEEGLKKYDIPLFIRRNGCFILHRVVALNDKGYVIVGDNQSVLESPVLPGQVLGIVSGFWRDGKYIPCNNFWYRIYSTLWVFGFPLRGGYLKMKSIGFAVRRLLGK